jgi:hypothetical protein
MKSGIFKVYIAILVAIIASILCGIFISAKKYMPSSSSCTVALFFYTKYLPMLFCPKPSENLIELFFTIYNETLSGGWPNVYYFDRIISEEEEKKPGSTLLLFFYLPNNRFIMILGSTIISFIVNGWILKIFPIGLLTVIILILGISYLFRPYIRWYISRPKPYRK